MSKIDLHTHTTASDGALSPPDLVQAAVDEGVTVLGIADHDTTDGLEPALRAAASYPQLEIIPAIELSTDSSGIDIHVLGYYIDYKSPDFQETLARLREGRAGRAEQMIEKLRALGMTIDSERVRQLAEGAIGRPHIARVLVERGYVQNVSEAFERYLGHGKPAYVPRSRLTLADVIQMIRGIGGVPVLAHPYDLGDRLEPVIAKAVEAGLMGLEVYYRNYGPDRVGYLEALADRYNLIKTGGTDFHGGALMAEFPIGSRYVPPESVEQLKEAAKRGRHV